jgi:hypothetical protein
MQTLGKAVAVDPACAGFEPLMTLYLTDRTSPDEIVRARASGPPMPCSAISAEMLETPAAPDTAEAAARGAAAPMFSSSPKPSAAVFAPLLEAEAAADGVDVTFMDGRFDPLG